MFEKFVKAYGPKINNKIHIINVVFIEQGKPPTLGIKEESSFTRSLFHQPPDTLDNNVNIMRPKQIMRQHSVGPIVVVNPKTIARALYQLNIFVPPKRVLNSAE